LECLGESATGGHFFGGASSNRSFCTEGLQEQSGFEGIQTQLGLEGLQEQLRRHDGLQEQLGLEKQRMFGFDG
jgi:hypothetical protein